MPGPCRITSSRFPVAPRRATFVKFARDSVFVSVYVPGAITIVVFDCIDRTACCSAGTDDTFTTGPDGGGNGGAADAGSAIAGRTAAPHVARAIVATSALMNLTIVEH